MIKKVLLKGYYGFGNLGDDVLMVTSYNYLKKIFPKDSIYILARGGNTGYVQCLVPEAHVVSSIEGEAELIVHGGGGVFFDFQNGSKKDAFINFISLLFGVRMMSSLLKKLRRIRGLPVEDSKYRIGIGLGIGTFTSSSRRLRSAFLELTDFNKIIVRDSESKKNFQRWNNQIDPLISSDLAFASDYWLPSELSKIKGEKKICVGLVLRAWPHNPYHHNLMLELANSLSNKSFDVEIFLFEKGSDESLCPSLEGLDIHIWNPAEIKLHEYLTIIKQMDAIVSARAHGAIIGAILEIPSLILELEPKLKTVHNMLNTGSILVDCDNILNILRGLEELLKNIETYKNNLQNDVNENRMLVNDSLQVMSEYLKGIYKHEKSSDSNWHET